jgi:hypothetical protein
MKRVALCVTIVGCALLFGVIVLRAQSTEALTTPTIQAREVSTPSGTQRGLATNKPRLLEPYGKVPLSFEPNRGQADPRVKFLSRGNGYTVSLTSNETVLTFEQQSSVTDGSLEGALAPHVPSKRPDAAVLRMRLVGGNAGPAVAGLDELPGKSNYFIGNDAAKWHTNIPTYGKVRYQEAYRGIDLIYYGNGRQLEYDFVVAPGADPSVITLGFDGAASMGIDSRGDLVLQSGAGEARFHKPVVYQMNSGDRTFVDGRYVRKTSNEIAFSIAEYDRTKALIIDPTLRYSTYLGGNGRDWPGGIAVDAAGQIYVTGYTTSTNFPSAGSIAGEWDAFVTAFDPTGSTLLYFTYLGGSGDEGPGDIAVDAAGHAYVTGGTTSIDFPTMNALQATKRGFADAFVAVLDSTGSSLLYSTYLGGTGDDGARGIAVDGTGHAYVTGSTTSTDFPTVNPFQATLKPRNALAVGFDAFITAFDPTGTALYSTYLGGTGDEYAGGIAVDGAGKVYVTGTAVWSFDFPTTVNAVQPRPKGIYDAYVTAFDPSGRTLLYSTYLGGHDYEFGYAIAVDLAGRAYVTGATRSTDFPTVNAWQPAHAGVWDPRQFTPWDAFVAVLDPTGSTLQYATYFGGSGSTDVARGIAVDDAGSASITGYTNSIDLPTVNPVQATNEGGGADAFVARFDLTGSTLLYATYLGGSDYDVGWEIAVDGAGQAYVLGLTFSTDFPTVNPFQPTHGGPPGGISGGGDTDTFVAVMAWRAAPPVFTPPGGTSNQPLSVALSTTTPGATMHYTTDGSTPTNASATYTGPISITQTTTLKAIATAIGVYNSDISSATYTLQAAAPTFDPPSASYRVPQRVSISDASPGTTLYYTTDGTTPTTSSPQYTRPFVVPRTATIRAIAVAAGWSQSEVADATYTITPGPPDREAR